MNPFVAQIFEGVTTGKTEEEVDNLCEKMLDNFDKLDREMKLMVVKKIMEEIDHREHLRRVSTPSIQTEDPEKNTPRAIEHAWLFKVIGVSVAATVVMIIVVTYVMGYKEFGENPFKEVFEIIKVIIGV